MNLKSNKDFVHKMLAMVRLKDPIYYKVQDLLHRVNRLEEQVKTLQEKAL